jgi:hypothetical protein
MILRCALYTGAVAVFLGLLPSIADYLILPASPIQAAVGAWQYPTKWGPHEDSTVIRPYTVEITEPVLDDLKTRLKMWRLMPTLGSRTNDWAAGTNNEYLTKFIQYWREEYDWRDTEKQLNKLGLFSTTIDGLQVVFHHVRPDRIPDGGSPVVLLLHGW